MAHNYNPGLRRLNIELKPGIPSEILSPKQKSITVLALNIYMLKAGVVVHACNSRTQKAEAERTSSVKAA